MTVPSLPTLCPSWAQVSTQQVDPFASIYPAPNTDGGHFELQDIPASDAALARLCKALEPTLFDKLAAHARLDIAAGPEPPVPEQQQQQLPLGAR